MYLQIKAHRHYIHLNVYTFDSKNRALNLTPMITRIMHRTIQCENSRRSAIPSLRHRPPKHQHRTAG